MSYGFFPHDYFAGSYFPAVWFAPADEEHLTPEEISSVFGGKRGRSPRNRNQDKPPLADQTLTVEEVRQQWELFDLRTQDHHSKAEPAPVVVPPESKPETTAEKVAIAPGDVSLSMPVRSQDVRAAIPAIGSLPDAALMTLAPDAAKAAIEAKRKSNNDALLAILMEL